MIHASEKMIQIDELIHCDLPDAKFMGVHPKAFLGFQSYSYDVK